MPRTCKPSLLTPVDPADTRRTAPPVSLSDALRALDIGTGDRYTPEKLPFLAQDATAGSECELQAAVAGDADRVDLTQAIRASIYFANVMRHAATEETPRRAVSGIEAFLSANTDRVWENAWIRVPLARLNDTARRA